MNKKIIGLINISISCSFLLVSCANSDIFFDRYTYGVKDTDTYEVIDTDIAYKPASYEPLSYLNDKSEVETLKDFTEVYTSQNYLHKINSVGNSKILVIPVDFSDYPAENLSRGRDHSRTLIENAFFGKEDRNQYESVASFFDKSSYGKLKLDGKVTDWYRSNLTYQYLLEPSVSKSEVIAIYNDALIWYQEKYGDLASYYVDGDKTKGVPVYFIYSAPNESSDSVLWAYTFNRDILASWTSFNMLNLDVYNKIDSHTLIHETGHLLGLDDYYATNGHYSPTGHVDMMDYSIGDETGFSKMLLNWVRPTMLKNSGTLRLKPFETTGDLFLVNKNWNKSQMDEYLLLEYYTPNGLNEKDSKNQNEEAKLMDQAGIKVYHVDARVGFYQNRIKPLGYISNGGYSKTNTRVAIVHTNSVSSGNEFTKYPLYQLLEKSGNNTFMSGGVATNDTLWHMNDTFGISTFKDYKFHNGETVGLEFTVNALTAEYAEISFTIK